MRVLKSRKDKFILVIDLAIFTGVIIGVLLATKLTDGKQKNGQASKSNDLQSLSTFVIGDYSEEDRSIANINLKQDLKKKYDIDVYSAESAEVAAKSVDASSLYDLDATYSGLNELVECLAKYPDNIFYEVQNKGYDLSIYLVDKFSNKNIALATRDSNNNFNIYISNTTLLEKAVHHELYHILEYYMKLEFDINVLYKYWDRYNPLGFEYNSDTTQLDSKYVYNESTNAIGACFVTIYAKSADKEDRAETFADMMIKNVRPSYYNEGENIRKKAEYISEVLDKSFESIKNSTGTLYWKRFL